MNIEQFISVNLLVWNNYLKRISKLKPQEGVLLFPNIILFTECQDFYIIELLGCNEKYEGLTTKRNKIENLDSYLYQFNHQNRPKRTNVDDSKIIPFSISNISFGSTIDEKILQERFFFQNRWSSKLYSSELSTVDMFKIPETINYFEFNNSCVVNKLEEIYRLKSIIHLQAISKKFTKPLYKKHLIQMLNGKIESTENLKGVLYSHNANVTVDLLYSQFLNIYSFQKLRETTIGEFLNQNKVILEKAFSSNEILYEPSFDWIEGNPEDDEKSINPDFMVKREDGYYDICDLKLPYWENKKLTKGKRKRRSFRQIVDDGISQLANYEDYFNFKKNAAFAEAKYNVKIKDPKLIIVIGNFYNYDEKEIEEASRKLKINYSIIDYDTLNLKFYNSGKNFA
jgi:hypothetical protein